MQMIRQCLKSGDHKVHKPPDTDPNGATDTVQGDFLEQQAFYQGSLILSNHTVVGVHHKLTTAGLALMVLLPRMNMAIFLKVLRSTLGTRVSHDHSFADLPGDWLWWWSTIPWDREQSITCITLPTLVLTHPAFNSSDNGLATFLYDDTQVSALRVQVVQETAPRAAFDGWGQTRLTYAPGPLANDAAVRAQFAAELQQTPIQPWAALPVAAGSPGVNGFDGDTAPDEVTASGLIVDGVIYLLGCETRWGPYPYCREMRHGVFSVTRSLDAAVALLRLAQTYRYQENGARYLSLLSNCALSV
jgi:hypothetical protein